MNDEQKIKILICDDHPIMRFGIAAIIQSQPNMTVAAQAGTAEEALRLFWEHRPDITLMDLRFPDKSSPPMTGMRISTRRSRPARWDI
jgi:DNA-binding NarL/FixJ family response regulator